MLGLCSVAATRARSLVISFAAPIGAGLAFLALEIGANLLILDLTGKVGPALLAMLGNLLASLRFCYTLLPGEEPLISRFSRYDHAGLPDQDGRYTRRLTMVWALVLFAFALAFLLAAAGYGATSTLSWLEPTILSALFLGEHVLRSRCFPEQGRVTPLRTLRAIFLSYRQARHAP
jgi:hypothetical protein